MINLTCKVAEHQKLISITEEAKLDMTILLSFLDKFNGTSMFLHDRFLSNKTLDLYTEPLNLKGSEVFMVTGGFMTVFQMIGK